eukprot:scaffold2698_cov48-Phaeocystis_antarctica.AAC.3
MSSLLASDKEFADCGVERGACDTRRGAGQETGGHWGGDGATSVQGRGRLQIGGRARGGAHVEHVAHVRDAGGVEAQRLVQRRRALPRVERRACGVGRGVRVGGAAGGGRPRRMQRAGEGAAADWGAGRGGARPEHCVHVCDAGGVEAQRLVERRRVLPRVERRACGAGRGMRVGGSRRWTTAVHAACRGGRGCRLGAGHGEERAWNMRPMSVTLAVFQLDMSASKFFKYWKRELMSVIFETSH